MRACEDCLKDFEFFGHADWCWSHPSKVAKRQAALEDASVWLDKYRASMDAVCGAPTIFVWRHCEAPEFFKTWDIASQDDVDWIAAIPPSHSSIVRWAEEGSSFGCFRVEIIALANGWELRYGYHA
jgi:hypothetical protein